MKATCPFLKIYSPLLGAIVSSAASPTSLPAKASTRTTIQGLFGGKLGPKVCHKSSWKITILQGLSWISAEGELQAHSQNDRLFRQCGSSKEKWRSAKMALNCSVVRRKSRLVSVLESGKDPFPAHLQSPVQADATRHQTYARMRDYTRGYQTTELCVWQRFPA